MVVAHLLVNIVQGLAHRELCVGLAPLDSIFVIVVVFIFPLIAMPLLLDGGETTRAYSIVVIAVRPLVFGVYQDFLAIGPDHVHWQPANAWGTKIALIAYLLLITEAIGTYFIVHFLWIAPDSSSKAAEVRFR